MQESAQPESQGDAGGPTIDLLARRKVRRFTAVEFLVVLVLWLASSSFLLEVQYGHLIETVLTTLVLMSAVVAVGGRRSILVAAILLVMPTLACKWIHHLRPDLVPREIYSANAMVFMGFIVAHFLRFILRAPRVNTEVLCAAVSVYLMLGILWAFAYMVAGELTPSAFKYGAGQDPQRLMTAFRAIYFSFVTLSTLGYGDILPTSNVTRMLATAEATTGMFYMTVLIARLVSLYSSEKPPDDESREATS